MRPLLRLALLAAAAALVAQQARADERLIVKFRDSNAAKSLVTPSLRLLRLAEDTGTALTYERESVVGAKLVRTPDAAQAAAVLAAHPDVEYAVPDRRMRLQRAANDEAIAGQTYLENAPASISAFAAWDITTGSAATVVAVLDTGYRPHADLAGRILPGYDFISDLTHANDGDGRDADASDPGDWVSAADKGNDAFKDCVVDTSSWHGTLVAGVIAANSNNGQWTAGIDWAAKILPVRVLGKCNGTTADIMEGVAWAAGYSVTGVPNNRTPAQVINLSLGGDGDCDAYVAEVISAVLQLGHTRAVIAAAGNSGDDVAGHFPANCPGVIAVASTNSLGNRATYSNFGARVALSAPGGEYSRRKGTDGIIALSNAGNTVPGADAFDNVGGTSFAAPMVAGVASLMLGVAPGLSADQVRGILTSTAKPFPPGSSCTTAICGTGIVDARAAVVAAKAIGGGGGGGATKLAIEFYNASLDHYFLTHVDDEIAKLDAGTQIKGWVRTGQGFNIYPSAQAGSSPVCRFYIPPDKGNSHFYGRGTAECNSTAAKNPTFINEDPQFFQVVLPTLGTCPAATTPVYRVFSNRPDANHRYMTSRAIRDQMVAKGWLAEGDGPDLVVMCSPN